MSRPTGSTPRATKQDSGRRTGKRITAVKVVRTDPNLRTIMVDGRVVARLTAVEVERLRLEEGAPWTAAKAIAVRALIEAGKARSTALAMLARRAMSASEVLHGLLRKHFSSELATRIVRELASDRWIDDESLARQIIEQARRKGHCGRAALLDRLARRGIDSSLAQRIVDEALRGTDQREEAIDQARALGARQPSAGPKAIRRVAAALARRGFDSETIEIALRSAGLVTDLD